MNQQAQDMLALCDRIMRAIELEDWAKVAELDDQRRRRIEDYFQSPATVDSDFVRGLKRRNDEILTRLVELRQQTMLQQQQLRQANKVSSAYLANSG